MSFDGIMMRHVTREMAQTLKNGRITKIYQLSNYDLLFNVRSQKPHAFLVSVSPQYTRIHLTDNDYEKPSHPPMFCMFLRKHLEGSIITDISQHLNDRVMTITVKTTNELGDLTMKHLIFEALGKDANIIVTDENHKILEALKHTGPFEEQARTIIPSALYHYPEDVRVNPFDDDALANAFQKDMNETTNLIQVFSGISPLFIKEFNHREKRSSLSPVDVFKSMLEETYFHILESHKTLYYGLKLTHLEGDVIPYETTTQLFDAYFFERDQADKRKQKAKDLEQFVKKQTERSKDKLEKLYKDLTQTNQMDHFKLCGELIMANQHLMKKGDRSLTCLNYYTNDEITIPLDAKKSAVKNSEQYYKKYKKTKKSIPHIHTQIRKTKEELDYFGIIKTQLDHANLSDIEEIREELSNEGYIKRRISHQKKAKKAHYHMYKDSEDLTILVGKNNLQNAQITHQDAQHFHIWFHVQNAPGSHVVVQEGFPLSESTIRTAANLAAYFSSMKDSSSVPVDYTEIKHIKKIPGKRNCFVRYLQHKTIYIDPDESLIKTLKKLK